MQQIELISKLGLAVIAITALSAAVAVQAFYHFSYFTQSSDAQAQELPVPVPPPNVPLNSVATQHIIDGQVMTRDLANENVTTAKIKDGEVKSVDIGDGEINTQDLASGAMKLSVRTVMGDIVTVFPLRDGFAYAECPSGEFLTGGGYFSSFSHNGTVTREEPVEGNLWLVHGHNNDPTYAAQLVAFVQCAKLIP